MSEAELSHQLAADRLRRTTLWGGVALLLAVLLPYELVDNQPHFLWELFGELPASSVVAALSPALAGSVVLAARRLTQRATSLAIAVVAALVAAALSTKLGADAAAWGLLPLPRGFVARAPFALLALALVAGAIGVAHRPESQRAARALCAGAAMATLVFYLWPGRGITPGRTLAAYLALAVEIDASLKLGALTMATVTGFPAGMVVVAAWRVWRPPAHRSRLTMVALGGLPLALAMLLLAFYMRAGRGAAMFAALGAAVEVGAVIALLAASCEPLALAAAEPASWKLAREDGWRIERSAQLAAALLASFALGQWWLALPPAKGVSWTLGAASERGDELFSRGLPRWNAARSAYAAAELRGDDRSTTRFRTPLDERAERMVTLGQSLSPRLGDTLRAMASAGTGGPGVAARTWFRRVADVNAACRSAELPYYLDPQIRLRKTEHGLQRLVALAGYRVARANSFVADGDRFTVLHLRGFEDGQGPRHDGGLLGLSRDTQPYALLSLSALEAHAASLEHAADEGICGAAFNDTTERTLRHCGARLAELRHQGALLEAVIASTERHELQHQLDGPLLPMARPVMRRLGRHGEGLRERVNRELSAYLAELAGPQPHLALVVPLRFALGARRGPYHHASVLLFGALDGTIRAPDDDGIARIFDTLSAIDGPALNRRARATWQRLYGDELPTVVAAPG
jgi:hypothetical protein